MGKQPRNVQPRPLRKVTKKGRGRTHDLKKKGGKKKGGCELNLLRVLVGNRLNIGGKDEKTIS